MSVMKFKKELDLINEIKRLAKFPESFIIDDEPFRIFGFDYYPVVFKGFQTVSSYQQKIEMLFESNENIRSTYSLDTYEKRIISLLRVLNSDNRNCTQN